VGAAAGRVVGAGTGAGAKRWQTAAGGVGAAGGAGAGAAGAGGAGGAAVGGGWDGSGEPSDDSVHGVNGVNGVNGVVAESTVHLSGWAPFDALTRLATDSLERCVASRVSELLVSSNAASDWSPDSPPTAPSETAQSLQVGPSKSR